jgi:hypothetical protein
VNAPGLVIRIEFEARPRIITDCLNSGEEARLLDWLSGKPKLLELLADAQELMEQVA